MLLFKKMVTPCNSIDQFRYTSLNGIESKEYLGKARDLFEQMNLQQDLKRLSKFLEKTA